MKLPSYGSVCSGIEAATVAWHSLGWRAAWFAEIEVFASKVLANHYPRVPNLGDMTKIAASLRLGLIEAPDILVGGTPCQAFSLAGLRQGLIDPRGQLTLAYADLADAIDEQRPGDECIIYWENVPGVLSSKDNAFGCFLGLLAGEETELDPEIKPTIGKNSKFWKWNKKTNEHSCRWPNAGCVYGPRRAIAWRVLDAQYFGVAQRRRRVFVVASARTGFDPAKLLFESDGVRRDFAPSREKGQSIAGTLTSRAGGGGFPGTDEACNGYAVASPVTCGVERPRGDGLDNIICMAHGQAGAEISVGRSPTLTCNHEAPIAAYALTVQAGETGKDDVAPCVTIAHVETMPTLRAGTPNTGPGHGARSGDTKDEYIVTVVHGTQDPCVSKDITFALGRNNGAENAVCVTEPVTHTLKADGFDGSEDGTGRGQPIVTWGLDEEQNGARELMGTLKARKTSGGHQFAVNYGMAVRRLIPRECERLQGFPDDHTLIPVKQVRRARLLSPKKNNSGQSRYVEIDGKVWLLAADGPRYKSLGNSMAVPCMRWLGIRLLVTHPHLFIEKLAA